MPKAKTPEAKARQIAHLQRGSKKGKRGKQVVDLGLFCLTFLRNKCRVADTARELGISKATIHGQYFKHPNFDAIMDRSRETLFAETAKLEAKRFVLDRSHLDTRLIRTLDAPKVAKPTTAAMVGSIALLMDKGYKSLGLGESSSVINNNTIAAVAASTMSRDVYEAAWLTERKANWSRELESKHGNSEQSQS